MGERGFDVASYDPIFFDNSEALKRQYDFLLATEVIEHFYRPSEEFSGIDRLVTVGGWIGFMTHFLSENEDFDDWYYPRDPTHVVFYSQESMVWLARKMGWRLDLFQGRVVIFQKSSTSSCPGTGVPT
jgi:hypothetical protein